MVISDPIFCCLPNVVRRWLSGAAERAAERTLSTEAVSDDRSVRSTPVGDGASGEADRSAPCSPPADRRRADAAALRALLLARQRRFPAAAAAFAEALRLDPTLDLTSVPAFWDLERSGHEAAVRAYEEVGREREALILAAKLRRTFRPRLARVSSRRGGA